MDEETPIWEQYKRGPLLGPRPGADRQAPAPPAAPTTGGPAPTQQPSIYEQRTQPAADEGIDWTDVRRGFGGGLQRGATALAGLPGDVVGVMRAGGDWIGNKLGLAPLPEDVRQQNAAFSPPSTADVRDVVEPMTGPFYQPTTRAGKYASTLGEFAPAAVVPGAGLSRFSSSIPGLAVRARSIPQVVGSKVLNTVAPAVASETAGQLSEGSPYEPYMRAIAGIGGGLTAARTVTPQTLAPNLPVSRALGTAAGAWVGHQLGGGLGALVGGGSVPFLHLTDRFMSTAPMQAYLNNFAVPQRARDVLTQTILQQDLAKKDRDRAPLRITVQPRY